MTLLCVILTSNTSAAKKSHRISKRSFDLGFLFGRSEHEKYYWEDPCDYAAHHYPHYLSAHHLHYPHYHHAHHSLHHLHEHCHHHHRKIIKVYCIFYFLCGRFLLVFFFSQFVPYPVIIPIEKHVPVPIAVPLKHHHAAHYLSHQLPHNLRPVHGLPEHDAWSQPL